MNKKAHVECENFNKWKFNIMISRKVFLSLLWINAIFPLNANQVIYQWADDKGELHFSDNPMPGSEKRVISEVQSYSSSVIDDNSSKKSSPTLPEQNTPPIYKSINFLTPLNNETIRDASATVEASLSIVPELNENHVIQFYLDDKAVGYPQKEINFLYQNIYRGSHSLSASIQDQSGKALVSTSKVTIFMHPPKINTQSKNYINVINPKRNIIVTQKIS